MKYRILMLTLLIAFAVPVFGQNADMSLIPYRQGNLWGYADPDKQLVIKPEYDEANPFYEGYASVKKGEKYGYINKAGKVVIPFKFFSARSFRFGYFEKAGNKNATADDENNQKTVLFAGASLQTDGYEICIDTKGNRMPKCPAIPESSAPEINKSSTVTVVSNYSTIQKSDLYDKITGDYKMPGAEESYYIAIRNGNYGIFNNTFEVIVPFEYSKIEKLNMGVMPYVIVEKDSLKGVLFGNGSIYMAVDNSRLDFVSASDGNNYLIFTKDGKTGIKNSKYRVIVEPAYTDIKYNPAGGFDIVGNENLRGYCFYNTNVILPRFAEVVPVKGTEFVKVKTQTGKWGYVSSNLIEYFEE